MPGRQPTNARIGLFAQAKPGGQPKHNELSMLLAAVLAGATLAASPSVPGATAGDSSARSLGVAPGATQLPAVAAPLRYDLRVGDHLVYVERLERRLSSSRVDSLGETEIDAHLLVLDDSDGLLRLGIQRNRTRAELKRSVENGDDVLPRARRELEEALSRRGSRFAETNWVRADGSAVLPWGAVREVSSERLPCFHEVEPLPRSAIVPGARFVSPALLGLETRLAGSDTIDGELCVRLEGQSKDGALRVRQWHCTSSGSLGRLEYDARYGAPGGLEVEEHYRLQRRSRARGETASQWLREPATARGALCALAVLDRLPVAPAEVWQAARSEEPATARQALALAWRHLLPPPSVDALRPLLSHASGRVRTLAVRLLGLAPANDEARSLLVTAASDRDRYVRAAASPHAPVREELVGVARAVRGSGPLPDWAGPLTAGIGRELLRAQRVNGQLPGTTLRFMADERFRGRPYVLHVPDDYRGDEPFPLVVVLGGGPGRALPTAQNAQAELVERGTLAVFPNADGMWWDERPGEAFEALLQELLAELNVDTDRVTITGWSNGGTGTILYASRLAERFAGYASLMGGGFPFFEQSDPLEPSSLAGLPALFVHGDRDGVIPSRASERTVQALKRVAAGIPIELRVLEGREHDVTFARDGELVFPFLEQRVRDPFPRKVSLRSRTLARAREFWVEVLDKSGGTAAVDGEIEGQLLRLRTRSVRRLGLHLRRELVDLDQPVRVEIDGHEAFNGRLSEDPALFLRTWRARRDPQLASAAELQLEVR